MAYSIGARRLHLTLLLQRLAAIVSAVALGVFHTVMRTTGTVGDVKPGDPAPDFSLMGSDGRTYRLNDLKGQPLVIAWFPKAFTGG
jgi:cytochrome oxidase Cu insertion factor (SCO1/SenC/PrrC family)